MKIGKFFQLAGGALGFLLIGGALILPRSYSPIKLYVLIGLLLVLFLNNIFAGAVIRVKRPMRFFLGLVFINIVAIIVGFVRGNPHEAIVDGLRQGVVFPLIIGLLWTFLADFKYEKYIQTIVLISATCVSLMIYIIVFQEVSGIQMFSDSFIEENELHVGVHGGYVQVVANCVSSLFFLFGYLFYYVISRDHRNRGRLPVMALICVLLAVLMSGRRALQIAVILAPVFAFFTSVIFSEWNSIKQAAIRSWIIVVVGVCLLAIYLFVNEYFYVDNFIQRFSGVFDDDGGARVSQAGSLWAGFLEYSFIGSGFGGTTDVARSEFPWKYELTYFLFLFNFGILGSFAVLVLFGYELFAIRSQSKHKGRTYPIEVKSIFCGLLFLLFGAATNPYLSSFEPMLFLGVIPFAAAIGHGRSARVGKVVAS